MPALVALITAGGRTAPHRSCSSARGCNFDLALTQPSSRLFSSNIADGLILPDAYARHVQHWLQRGASVVGGCCGVGPAHIKLLRGCLDEGRWAAVEEPGSGKRLG